MRVHRSFAGLSVVAFLLGSACLLPAAVAGDYYSWIDSSGTMVMTDDPSKIPSVNARSEVQVHRFQEVSASPSGQAQAEPAPHERSPEATHEQQAQAVDPADLDLPPILLEEPTTNVGAQYIWVPLLSPLFIGGNTVAGFWWHRGTASPVEAFKHFLAQYYRQQGVPGPWVGGFPSPHPRVGWIGMSRNPIHDRVTREQQALIEARTLHFRSTTPGTARNAPRGGDRHSAAGR